MNMDMDINNIAFDLELKKWTDGPKYIIFIGTDQSYENHKHKNNCTIVYVDSEDSCMDWIKTFPYQIGTIYVDTTQKLLYDLQQLRPELDIQQIPSTRENI